MQLRNETPQKFFPANIAENNKPTTRWSQIGLFVQPHAELH